MSSRNRQPGPWYGSVPAKRRFEQNAKNLYPDLRSRVVGAGATRAYEYRVTIPLDDYPDVAVRVRFRLTHPTVAEVFADSPASPHRFDDNTLCMWFPKDGPDRTWQFKDGLVALLAYVAGHAFREYWWDEYGEWLGDEAPHRPVKSPDERRAA